MKITHYSNSFISVRSLEDHMVCDPWMGKANTGGWQSFPEYHVNQLATHLSDARFVYLSHLHDDHFHSDTLISLGLIDREFIIKRFQTPVMRDRLKKLGVKVIHELDPFTQIRLGSFDIAIFPQMSSNSSSLEDDVDYDLDTSIAIKCDDKVFFNQVDNPLSTSDLLEVRDWILLHLGELDIVCLMAGAASEYPHLFLGIDQPAEKKRIIDDSLFKLINWLELLQPKYYFPAGGTYIIPGKLSIFLNNIAQPTFKEIDNLITCRNIPVRMLPLEGGKSVLFTLDNIYVSENSEIMPIEANLEAAIEMHKDDSYDYEVLAPTPFENILELLTRARSDWLNRIKSDSIKITQSIRFQIYQDLVIKNGLPDQSLRLGSFQLYETTHDDSGNLIIHIDHRALIGCLTRRFIWNGVLGSLCLYERTPNQYFPNDFFSLNYLYCKV